MKVSEWLTYGGILLGTVVTVLLTYKLIFALTDNWSIIKPAPGIECVVVERSFTASVDCWETPRARD